MTPPIAHAAATRYANVNAVAQRFGVSKMTIYREINRGHLRAVRIGKTILVPLAEIARFEAHGAVQPGDFDTWAPPRAARTS